MAALSLDAWISIFVTFTVVGVIQFRRGAPVDLLFLAGLIVVTLNGIISPVDAVNGFRSTAVIAIGSLFVVSAGLRATGVLDWVGEKLLGTARSERSAVRRLAVALVRSTCTRMSLIAMCPVLEVLQVAKWASRRDRSITRRAASDRGLPASAARNRDRRKRRGDRDPRS